MVTRKGTEASAVGEVDVDVAEIGFEAAAGEVSQRDEGFLMSDSVPPQVALHLGVTAGVAVLVAEPPEHLGGGMPLLGRRGLVVDQDLIDDRVERPEDRRGSVVGPGIGAGLGTRRGPAGSSAGCDERCARSGGWTCHRVGRVESLRNRPP